ncbi:unnamed protein product [Parajaminaea phylloscopi]
MTATTARPLGPRALPGAKPACQGYEPTWYEAEERIAPSYVSPPSDRPPLSPSARWNLATTEPAFEAVSPAQYGDASGITRPPWPQTAMPSPRLQSQLPPGAAAPYHYYEAGDRLASPAADYRLPFPDPQPSTYPVGADVLGPPYTASYRLQASPVLESRYAPGQSTRTARNGKGSAFMHKGFLDILQLVNDRDNPANPHPSELPTSSRDTPLSPSRFKTTLGRATGALRRTSNPPRAPEECFASVRAPATPQQLTPQRFRASTAASIIHSPSAQAFTPPPLPGTRAAKKRISVDMVSAPRPSSFIHAAHASDAEQAEAILNRWSRDGVGKVADPTWVEPIKEALKMQAARNQAEAIAQVQAALHEGSAFDEQERSLHIMNGLPSSMIGSTLTGTTTTTGGATTGHAEDPTVAAASRAGLPLASPLQTPAAGTVWTNPFNDIAEEGRTGSDDIESVLTADTVFPIRAEPHTPDRSGRPSGAKPDRLSPLPATTSRPTMPPRSNTAGTVLVNPTPSPNARAQAEAPDYMAYRSVPPAQPDQARQAASKAIDGLPGAGTPIATMFHAPETPATSQRPTSMVVRDLARAIDKATLTSADTLAAAENQIAVASLRPSLTTVEKSVAAKIFFENLYYGILKKPAARETRRAGLEKELAVLRIPEASKEAIRQAWLARETEHLRQVRDRVSANSFVKMKTIGHGAFGVVALCQEKGSGELYAMKQLRKADMLRKGQEGHVRAERDLMTSASASGSRRWIVNLVYSFQDVDHLYLIMEFMGGGDLLNLLIEKDIFAEDFGRFYVAEMILAIHEAHKLGYIHRDIKPDNFLFTSRGHIKLADFGLCQSFHWAHDGAYYDQQRRNLLRKHGIDLEDAGGRRSRAVAAGRNGSAAAAARGDRADGRPQLDDRELGEVMSDRNPDGTPLTHVLTWRDKNKKKIAYSVVGTNNYMAPEVLRGHGYDQSCDWWSLGVIVFEMLYGYPPFVSKSRHLTRQKILNWRQTLKFPPKPKISREAQDFIARLVCEKDDRLGSTSNASVSRPNSLLQGARQQSGFAPNASAATSGGGGGPAGAGLVDGVEDLMSHPWFKGIDWMELHRQEAPFRPELTHPADTKHFEDDIEDEPLAAPGATPAENGGMPPPPDPARDPMLRDKAHGPRLLEMRKQLAFVGYTFKRPPAFDPREIHEADVVAAERAAEETARRLGMTTQSGGPPPMEALERGSRMRSMSM